MDLKPRKIAAQFGLLVFLLLPWRDLYSQSGHLLTEYTTEQGLSLNSVNDLLFDKQGFLWVTTADGLQRFDGYRFQTYRHDPADKKSLPENSVFSVYEDDNSNLWITHRTGICFKPKGRNEFFELTPSIVPAVFKLPLICTGETDSAVWITGYPFGVFAVNKYTLQATKIFSFAGAVNNEIILPMTRFYRKGDRVWLRRGKDKRSDLYRIGPGGIRQFVNRDKRRIYYLVPFRPDSLVVFTDQYYYLAGEDDPFTVVKIAGNYDNTRDFDYEHLNLIRRADENRYFLQGIDRLFVYAPDGNRFYECPYEEYFPRELSRMLSPTAIDRHQNTWIGFNGIGGIRVKSVQKFSLFERPQPNSLPYCLTGDRQGNIYAGIYHGDIEVYDRGGRFLKTLALPPRLKTLGSSRAMAMIDTVTLAIRSTINELYAVDVRSGRVELLSGLLPARGDSVIQDFEADMKTIGDGEVWFTYGNCLLSLRKKGRAFSCDTVYATKSENPLVCFARNSQGETWVSNAKGVIRMGVDGEQPVALPTTYVKHINFDQAGRAWLATTSGILIVEKGRVLKSIGLKEGLPNPFVYAVLMDHAGNAWVSTNRGLSEIIPPATGTDSTFRIISYTAKEGLQGDEFNTRGYYKGGDGTLYFAGVNGINFFRPEQLVSKSGASPTMLTRVEVNNLPYQPGLQPEFISSITLSHRENNISLSFSCMDFTVAEKNQYRFWLKGFQNDWTLPQTNNTIQYILPVGEYQLHVLGANYEGVWAKEPLVLTIRVLPPWYQTRWAQFIFGFLALSMVAALFYFVSRNRFQRRLRQLQMEQEVQLEKQRLSRDLHDNLGSQLTWLSGTISQLQTAAEQGQQVDQRINLLKEGAGGLMQTLRETIWILNREKIGLVEFFDKLVTHAARHLGAYPGLELQTENEIAVDHRLNSAVALQLFRICQEAITNACKHSGASLLRLRVAADDNGFFIAVSDNGKGIDKDEDAAPGHYGLQNMEERARESGLHLQIHSTPGSGTAVTVSKNETSR